MEGLRRSSCIEAAAVAEIVEVVKIVEAKRRQRTFQKPCVIDACHARLWSTARKANSGTISYDFNGQC